VRGIGVSEVPSELHEINAVIPVKVPSCKVSATHNVVWGWTRHQRESLDTIYIGVVERMSIIGARVAGWVSVHGQLVRGRHEAVITQALFDRVQDVLEARSRDGKRDRVLSHYSGRVAGVLGAAGEAQ